VSVEVGLGELEATLNKYPFVYLLTVGNRTRPHVSACGATVAKGLLVLDVGWRSRALIEDNEAVTLLAPPYEFGGYSLIIDGSAAVAGESVVVALSRAVLHRPAPLQPAPAVGGCGSDCVPIAISL
jgi:hypothetical protein